MTKFSTNLHAAALGLALVLTSPAGQITTLATGALLLGSGQAMAQGSIPGVGVVIKKKPGNAPIAEGKSDEKGLLEFSGLEPGEYSVCFADDEGKGDSCADVKVDKEGMIRGETVFDKERQAANAQYQGHILLLPIPL